MEEQISSAKGISIWVFICFLIISVLISVVSGAVGTFGGEAFIKGANPINIASKASDRLETSVVDKNFASFSFILGLLILLVYFLAILSLVTIYPGRWAILIGLIIASVVTSLLGLWNWLPAYIFSISEAAVLTPPIENVSNSSIIVTTCLKDVCGVNG